MNKQIITALFTGLLTLGVCTSASAVPVCTLTNATATSFSLSCTTPRLPPGKHTVSVAVDNTSFTTTFTVGAATPPPAPAGCANPSNIQTAVNFVTDRSKGFVLPLGRGQWSIIKFTTPNNSTPIAGVLQFSSTKYYLTRKTISLSLQQCNFINPIGYLTKGSQSANMGFTINQTKPGAYRLQPNTTYYLNVKNEIYMEPGVDTCPIGQQCGYLFGLTY